jgi:dihydrodipicolinate synthase/N-acetylneuraminate lyase
MKTTPPTPADFAASVLAVPPLARKADLGLDRAANAALIRHVEAGGIRTLMYGGNANFYHVGMYEFGAILDMIAELAGPATWVIPSIGPDYGKMIDQAQVLRASAFPTAMVLPPAPPVAPAGMATGLRRVAERAGRPLILYVKSEGVLAPAAIAALVADGTLAGIKYAVARPDPARDDFLRALADAVGPQRIVSGMGERPAIAHLRGFGLAAFTSGCVCIAPRASQALLAACRRGDWDEAERRRAVFVPAEDFREAHGFIPVLHDAVGFAGVAPMGPMLPLLDNLPAELHGRARELAAGLVAAEARLAAQAA